MRDHVTGVVDLEKGKVLGAANEAGLLARHGPGLVAGSVEGAVAWQEWDWWGGQKFVFDSTIGSPRATRLDKGSRTGPVQCKSPLLVANEVADKVWRARSARGKCKGVVRAAFTSCKQGISQVRLADRAARRTNVAGVDEDTGAVGKERRDGVLKVLHPVSAA